MPWRKSGERPFVRPLLLEWTLVALIGNAKSQAAVRRAEPAPYVSLGPLVRCMAGVGEFHSREITERPEGQRSQKHHKGREAETVPRPAFHRRILPSRGGTRCGRTFWANPIPFHLCQTI